MRKLAIMLSASALLLGLAAASANAHTQTAASQLRASILNATPVVQCQRNFYWLCKPTGEGTKQQCSCKCCKHYPAR
jgi:hypothetical protein